MPNHILDDYLDAVKRQLRHLPLREQRQVLAEIRAHLDEGIAQRQKGDKALSRDEATLQATHDFGDPKDLGVAHGAQGGVVRKSTGEVLLHVAVLTGRGVARTVRTTFKWLGITVLVLLTLGTAVAIAAAFIASDLLKEYKDEIVESVPRPIYHYEASYDLEHVQATTRSDSFQVSSDARGFDLAIDIQPEGGCLAIQVTAPDGSAAFDNGQGCSATNQGLHFSDPGRWTIRYTFVTFTGSVDVEAYEYLEANA